MLTGWFRQQIVKLYVPSLLGSAGYLTLDSDVICVGDFDAMTFVHKGRALSRWEPKDHHDWWQRAAKLAGVPSTPAPTACRSRPTSSTATWPGQALAHFHSGAIDPVTTLGVEMVRRLGTIPWTENSLYTSVAEPTATCSTISPLGPLLRLGYKAFFRAFVRLGGRRFHAAATPVQGQRSRWKVHHRAEPCAHTRRAGARVLLRIRRLTKKIIADIRVRLECGGPSPLESVR